MRKHIMIPDCQVTPDTPTDHLRWIGEYIVEQKPDAIINIGDFADMESLSFFDKEKGRGRQAIHSRYSRSSGGYGKIIKTSQ